MENKKVILSRPKDKSLESFKAWIMELTLHMTGKAEDTMTPAEWEEKWKEFWGNEIKDT